MPDDNNLSLYKINWKLHAIFLLMLFLVIVLLRGQSLIIQMPRPATMAIFLLAIFSSIGIFAKAAAQKIEETFDAQYPSFMLWLYPTLVLACLAGFSFLLITTSGYFFGRGFWSNLLQLNGQETTRFFSTCFTTMIVFTATRFLIAMTSMLVWIYKSSISRIEMLNSNSANRESHEKLANTIDQIRSETEKIREHRLKASRINRLALLGIFLLLTIFFCWITFVRPEVVLYYRAEIQLRTFIEPMTAYNTLKHLSKKFPQYPYLDSVRFRMAWILDRRMNKFDEATADYLKFIDEFAPKSSWSDEAYVSLVRLYSDKLNQPEKVLKYSEKYLQLYPYGVFAPHMHIYRTRAFQKHGNVRAAMIEIELALKKFYGKKMQIINSEDRLIELVSFDDAIRAEINAEAVGQ